ncbi:ergothioneine biosynthesis glutamate--cysteine ligase EgtA [Rhodococcus sp. MTM3W5.2]|uniref:ergothioneine biosynthesis glutamate--cysteine ligase EgtA n=1 Tax=Rhodococcus sp. MTM3W5.2 TaxID=1805827 RepID=UPI0009791C40|nr:ergothioneine biosynthesis glutamate--cysteine ligase EgtA [Rhodococcus sp. MTM3W5.2]AQA20872.1 ergothioneine biosynthesis glutamate--cysteine ligase EgtA [Rhodococcus sp. MTM3W5.2]
MAMAVDSRRLTTRAAAEAYVGGVCFKLGPPRLIGAELEWLTARDDPARGRPDLGDVAAALGPHAPTSIAPSSPALSLPSGSAVTIEPGGQIELSSAPLSSAEDLCVALAADEAVLRRLLTAAGITVRSHAADRSRHAERLLRLPRYRAMEERFDGIGPFGRLMMCNTAATQVSVDAGADPAEVAARWRLLHDAGPALLAAFACSPRLRGTPDGGWASQRMRTWLELDPDRTRPLHTADPIADYGRWALDVPLLCVTGGRGADSDGDWSAPPGATFADWIAGALDAEIDRRPDPADLDYHLTTLFPPVRAAGHLEVRYLDAQPGDLWRVPIAALAALLGNRDTVAEATAIAASTAGRWRDGAEFGLRDGELRRAASELLFLAAARSPRFEEELASAAERCCRGVTPAEEYDR